MFKRLLAHVGKLIGRAHALPATSDRNLAAQFDDAIRRQAEIFHRAFRIAQHPREQFFAPDRHPRSEEHTSELQSLMRISYAVFCLKKKNKNVLALYHYHTAAADGRWSIQL